MNKMNEVGADQVQDGGRNGGQDYRKTLSTFPALEALTLVAPFLRNPASD